MITIIKKSINTLFPFVRKIYVWYTTRERKVSYGNENADKTFYVIGKDDSIGGLWWLVNKVVMHIAYAKDKKYIPVVDYKNYTTQYTYSSNKSHKNIWELFFEQPYGYTLEDINNSKNIIINCYKPAPNSEYLMGQNEFYDDQNRIDYFKSIFNEYIKFNKQTRTLLENKFTEIIGNDKRVVGVLCRGTDYVLMKPKGHPVQPTPEQVCEDVDKVMKEYHCDYVFLATEDADIFEYFKNKYVTTQHPSFTTSSEMLKF